nr:neurogenic locus notch homolog protein 4-like [Chelonoidis abingdonii]
MLTPPQDEAPEGRDLDARGPDGVTPLMAAVCAGGTVGELLAQGARLDAQTDATGETALHLAARFARASAVRSLLDAGADPNVRDRAGRSPLHSAIGADALGACQVSVRGVWMRCGDGNGEPPVLCLALQSLCPTQNSLETPYERRCTATDLACAGGG